jgi:hypothetical protein
MFEGGGRFVSKNSGLVTPAKREARENDLTSSRSIIHNHILEFHSTP